MKTLRNEVAVELARRGVNQRWLAAKSGVAESVVSKFLANRLPRGLTTNNVEKILNALDWDGVKFPKPPKE